MTSGAPWSVKGIDPKAREVAKDLARRSGLTLGEWLNRMILEDDGPDEVTSEAYFSDRGGRTEAQRLSAQVRPGDEIARVIAALDHLTARIEASEARTGQIVAGVEQSVRDALSRIEAAEQDHVVPADEVRAAPLVADVRSGESAAAPAGDAIRALEAAINRVAGQLVEHEGRSRDALAALERRLEKAQGGADEALANLRQSFAALDGRIGQGAVAQPALHELAESLARKVEAGRAEVAAQLAKAAEERFEGMEKRLGAMAEQIAAGERRSTLAVERMGREVLTVAQTLSRRVQAAEQRSAQVAEQAGEEMARIAQTVEGRLGRNERTQAEALERLGAEISRISERLTDRVTLAERRAGQAIDEVGDQVARVTERLSQRTERVSEEFADRIRQSEARTARLLEEARERIDQRLAETQRRSEEVAQTALNYNLPEPEPEPAPFPSCAAAAEPAASRTLAARADSGSTVFSSSYDPDRPALQEEDFEAADGFSPFNVKAEAATLDDEPEAPAVEATAEPASEPEDTIESEPLTADDGPTAAFWAAARSAASADDEAVLLAPTEAEREDPFAAALAKAEPDTSPLDFDAPPVAEADAEPALSFDAAPAQAEDPDEALFADRPEPERALTTRELIEQARAAARAAPNERNKKPKLRDKIAKSERAARPPLFSGFGAPPKKRLGSTLPTALLFAGGAAALGVAATGVVILTGDPAGAPPARVADAMGRDGGEEILTAEVEGAPTPPRAAVALSPKLLEPSAVPVGPASAAAQANLPGDFAAAVGALEAGERGGVDQLRRTANLGYAPAQSYLAELYAAGGAGLKKDPVEARRWAERAAQGGERKAMHNLALYLFEGAGGPKDAALAAQWFRRAAELGLVDSQFNLAQLYEHGSGVGLNGAEAYKWYLIAGRSGDAEARASALRLRERVSPEARAVAERAAAAFRSTGGPTSGALAQAAASEGATTAQRALSRLGYYQGPADGVVSPALRMAIAAYQRDQGFDATGVLDQATLSRLAVFTR